MKVVAGSGARSGELYERALGLLPGGVNSPVRAMRSIGRDPILNGTQQRRFCEAAVQL